MLLKELKKDNANVEITAAELRRTEVMTDMINKKRVMK